MAGGNTSKDIVLGNDVTVLSRFRYILCEHFGLIYLSEYHLTKCFLEIQNLIESKRMKATSEENISPKEVNDKWWKHLIAGAAAGTISRTFTAPFDRLKVTLQVQAAQTHKETLRTTFKSMVKEGGFRSLWRGNGISVLKIMPEMALKFSVYNEVKNYIKATGKKSELDVSDRFIAGSIAGFVSQSFIFPLEMIKTRLILRKSGQSCWSCVHDIFSNKKVLKNLYRGFIPNTIGIIPYAGIDLAVYETLKKECMSRGSFEDKSHIIVHLGCGVVSSACGQIVSYPFNLVKTKLQAECVDVQPVCSFVSTIRNILVMNGVSGLYKGLSANLLKVVPSVAIGYVIYEQMRSSLGATMS